MKILQPGVRFTRMSWIKPNFLWMMYLSNREAAEGQEVVLALRLRRAFFESLLEGTNHWPPSRPQRVAPRRTRMTIE
ncbi:MAG TPA: DUF4291 family protein [Pirellulales bacterium]|nr:DUF4291 family protein [Pirellulales bacterium]